MGVYGFAPNGSHLIPCDAIHPVHAWCPGATRPAIPLIGETRAIDGGWRQACPDNHACDWKMRVTAEAKRLRPRPQIVRRTSVLSYHQVLRQR